MATGCPFAGMVVGEGRRKWRRVGSVDRCRKMPIEHWNCVQQTQAGWLDLTREMGAVKKLLRLDVGLVANRNPPVMHPVSRVQRIEFTPNRRHTCPIGSGKTLGLQPHHNCPRTVLDACAIDRNCYSRTRWTAGIGCRRSLSFCQRCQSSTSLGVVTDRRDRSFSNKSLASVRATIFTVRQKSLTTSPKKI